MFNEARIVDVGCTLHGAAWPELYFYDELSADDRAAFETHLQKCNSCRSAHGDLQTIREAIDSRQRSAKRSSAEWDDFMSRLDRNLDVESAITGSGSLRRWMPGIGLAAAVAIAVLGAVLWRQASTPAPTTSRVSVQHQPAAITAELGREHAERSKLVILGLLTKDPTRDTDWDYEQRLAESLLPDTLLHRMAASEEGLAPLAETLGDLEAVLLQAAYSDKDDPQTLSRLQRLIRQRDLAVKIDLLDAREPVAIARGGL